MTLLIVALVVMAPFAVLGAWAFCIAIESWWAEEGGHRRPKPKGHRR